jgi:hypothetical protein
LGSTSPTKAIFSPRRKAALGVGIRYLAKNFVKLMHKQRARGGVNHVNASMYQISSFQGEESATLDNGTNTNTKMNGCKTALDFAKSNNHIIAITMIAKTSNISRMLIERLCRKFLLAVFGGCLPSKL